MPQLGVQFQDGGLITFATRLTEAERVRQAKEARDGANENVKPGQPLAKIVSIDVEERDIVELTDEDLDGDL